MRGHLTRTLDFLKWVVDQRGPDQVKGFSQSGLWSGDSWTELSQKQHSRAPSHMSTKIEHHDWVMSIQSEINANHFEVPPPPQSLATCLETSHGSAVMSPDPWPKGLHIDHQVGHT